MSYKRAWVSPWSRGQSPPEPPGCLILEELQTPHKQETRGLETIRSTSFFPWWLLRFFQEKGDLKKILRNHLGLAWF